MCFRVDIDINKPLRQGIHVQVTSKPLWIHFKSVKLYDFCYGCERLGHVLGGCDMVEAREHNPGPWHGRWLRASLLKSRRHNADSKLLEEKKLFLVFQNKRALPTAKTKLVFENPTFMETTSNGRSLGHINSSIMNIDDATPIAPRSEVFKRKQGDIQLHKGDERKVRLVSTSNEQSVYSISAEVAEQPRPVQ